MRLSDIIIAQIEKHGPISFHDFMEMCLYHPQFGYYTTPQNKIGQDGDYYTSAYITPAFGAMIGAQIEEMWRILGEKEFTIVEYGAGTGFLCHDILNYLKNNKELYDNLNYCIIEKSPVMREKEKTHLLDKVSWHESIAELDGIYGCILSNELLDNFSVHQVVMLDELMEVFVDYKNGFREILLPASDILKDYLYELDVILPRGFRTEINLEATEWIEEISASLEKGYVLTIDYGYPSDELYRDYRREGTLVCYNKHAINDQPYRNIGEQDITAHVNFSALHHWGMKNGLDGCGYTDQAHFLLSLGFEDHLKKLREQDSEMDQAKEAFLTHTLLVNMGSKFKVLIQKKGLDEKNLSGLSLSQYSNSSVMVA